MYSLIQDRGMDTEETIWEGEVLAVGQQKFNAYKNSCEKGDFEVLELLRRRDDGEWAPERVFRFK